VVPSTLAHPVGSLCAADDPGDTGVAPTVAPGEEPAIALADGTDVVCPAA
jgi:hypothetical protein